MFVTAPAAQVNKRLVLVVIAMSQLMVVLDGTIVNVALNNIRTNLGFVSDSDLSRVVTAYTLGYGGFLLVGGKLADRLGRRKIFLTGAVVFSIASLLGGFAQSQQMLIGARLLQGVGGALMTPAALSVLTVVFEQGPERNKALGLFSAITAAGSAIGLLLGGVLTEYFSWRLVLFVNIPIAVLVMIGALRFVPESKGKQAHGFDLTGAVLVTGGLSALVFGLTRLTEPQVSDTVKDLTFGLAFSLLAGFVAVQRRTRAPLVPLHLFQSKSLLGADLGAFFVGAGIFAVFFFATLWMQVVNGYSPIKAGLAFLPMAMMIGASAHVGAKLLARTGPGPLLMAGMALAGTGLLALGLRLHPDSSYLTVVLPSLALVEAGMGMTFVALTAAAVGGISTSDAGIASALLNASQQVGGALGLVILTAVSTHRTASLFQGDPHDPARLPAYFNALVSGWSTSFLVAGGFLFVAGAIMSTLIGRSAAGSVLELDELALAA